MASDLISLEKSASSFDEANRNKWNIFGAVSATAGVLAWVLRDIPYAQIGVAATLYYLVTGRRYEWLYVLYKTLPRDLRAGYGLFRVMFRVWWWERQNMTVASVFTDVVAKTPQKVAYYFEDKTWTFQRGEDFSNRIAWYFKRQGFKRGECVSLVMETKPEFIFIWIGLAKIGVVSALVNFNLRNDSLAYCVKVSNCKAVIFGNELLNAIKDIQHHQDLKGVPLFQFNTATAPTMESAVDLSSELLEMPTTQLLADISAGNTRDKLLYIYTSGTTGLPKAAIITNMRYMLIPFALHTFLGMNDRDILYDPLPLYHTAGGVLGAGQALIKGTSVVLRNKFSASNFWNDCVRYNCTVAQYIGEMCRYLLAMPENEAEKQHKIRVMLGNGLRPQIWRQFVERFRIKRMGEFYGATEGNSNLINLTSKEGAVGFMCRFCEFVYPLALVRCNEETGTLLRDMNGKCIKCKPLEPGILLGMIKPEKAILSFAGYADKSASEKKLVKDVFKDGDCYFNSGDVMTMDHLGYFYFKDRTGDTYRWRGENVSTTEVEAVISNLAGLSDAVVYGVSVPHTEGRAGMAAIVDPTKKVVISDLAKGLQKSLPSYARPLFLRIIPDTPLTSTFKLKKKELVTEGFDINVLKDDLYFLDAKTSEYVPLTKTLYECILKGTARL